MRRSWQHGPVFSPAGRSGGSQALQLPQATFSRGSSNIRPHPARVPQKSELPASVLSSPIEEVWRASGPPAPSSIKFSRKFSIPSTSRPCTTEAGNFRSSTIFFHPRRGLDGARPSHSLEQYFAVEDGDTVVNRRANDTLWKKHGFAERGCIETTV